MNKVLPPEPPYIEAKNYSKSNNHPINRIVIHCTASLEPEDEGAAKRIALYFAGTDRFASAHYVRDSKESYQCVFDSFVAYHAPPNTHSIGYEIVCNLSNKGKLHWRKRPHRQALLGAAKDCARLALAYDVPIKKIGPVALRLGKKGFCGHIDVSRAWAQTNHWDPGPFFPWKWFMEQVQREAELLMVPDTVPEPAPPVKYSLKEIASGVTNNIVDQVWAMLRLRARTHKNEKRRRRLRQIAREIRKF